MGSVAGSSGINTPTRASFKPPTRRTPLDTKSKGSIAGFLYASECHLPQAYYVPWQEGCIRSDTGLVNPFPLLCFQHLSHDSPAVPSTFLFKSVTQSCDDPKWVITASQGAGPAERGARPTRGVHLARLALPSQEHIDLSLFLLDMLTH